MIKIKLYEHEVHRNETTFRPFVKAMDIFREVGIEFTTSDDYDYAFVGQASIIDKKKPLRESIDNGIEFLSKITGDYMIVDGQDATTLIGTIDVFRESNALLFLKNSYLKDFNLYKQGWANGRYYWGKGNYSVSDIDVLKPRMKLTGCNWLHTMQPQWSDYGHEKKYDISCMFGYPTKTPVYEHDICQTDFYDPHRKNLMDVLGDKYKIAGLVDGERIPINEYYQKMYDSKIIMAPLGYGEMAPRDLESAQFGGVLIKPDMSHIVSEPFIYEDNVTYISVNYDWSNLEEKVDYVLSDYNTVRDRLVTNMKKQYEDKYNLQNLVIHLYKILTNLDGVGVE
jgi:hypothetical protein|tara:strand:+ start:1861 stop:2877 length:1017 start_codon:yes stop_codon:yes gene_type:complete